MTRSITSEPLSSESTSLSLSVHRQQGQRDEPIQLLLQGILHQDISFRNSHAQRFDNFTISSNFRITTTGREFRWPERCENSSREFIYSYSEFQRLNKCIRLSFARGEIYDESRSGRGRLAKQYTMRILCVVRGYHYDQVMHRS